MSRRDPEPKLTDAQLNAAAEAANQHPPVHEQHPLSEREQHLVDQAIEQQMRGQR